MNAPTNPKTVDVLAVMDRARRTISAQSKLSDDVMAHLADDVAQARNAMADLIGALRPIFLADEMGEYPEPSVREADLIRAALAKVQP